MHAQVCVCVVCAHRFICQGLHIYHYLNGKRIRTISEQVLYLHEDFIAESVFLKLDSLGFHRTLLGVSRDMVE
jgi:hypothetical protein